MYVVDLSVTPMVDNRNIQHDVVLDPAPGEPLQGYPDRNNPQLEGHWSGKVATSTRGASLH